VTIRWARWCPGSRWLAGLLETFYSRLVGYQEVGGDQCVMDESLLVADDCRGTFGQLQPWGTQPALRGISWNSGCAAGLSPPVGFWNSAVEG
jgi:hypothetical protein